MPRQARKKSKTEVYHVMMRGINKQVIFEDLEDNRKFIKTLSTYRETSGYKLFAYCLMGNHCHLLIRADSESIEKAIKRIAGSYVFWYNRKYDRSGHLFQDRFKSEAVENDRYLLAVLRYIHQNPVRAGLCKNVADYEFSSYGEYLKSSSGIVDTEFILSMVSKGEFTEFHRNGDDNFMDIEEKRNYISDINAIALIKEIGKCKSTTDLQSFDVAHRDKVIAELLGNSLSIRQISRLTGVSKGVVERISRK